MHMNNKLIRLVTLKKMEKVFRELGSRLKRYLRRMEHGLKFQEFIGYGRRKDTSNLKTYNSKNEEEEINLRNHQKGDLMRLTISSK